MDPNEFGEFVRSKAAENFRCDGHLEPVIVSVQPPGLSAVALPVEDKDKAARLLQRVRATGPLVAVVTEAWYVDLAKLTPEQQQQAMDMPPREHPKRKEVAIVTVYHGLQTTMHAADIIRSGRKKPVLGPWKVMSMTGADGRFVTPPAEWNCILVSDGSGLSPRRAGKPSRLSSSYGGRPASLASSTPARPSRAKRA